MAPRASKPRPCKHELLTYLCSPHFGFTEYKPSSTPVLQAAAELDASKKHASSQPASETELPNGHSWSFPSPLLLPDDALDIDPSDEGPQSFDEWRSTMHRHVLGTTRRTIYVCSAPTISTDIERTHHVRDWAIPVLEGDKTKARNRSLETSHVVDYLSAFYHGIPVKTLDAKLSFARWDEDESRSTNRRNARRATQERDLDHIGLATSESCTRIRTRLMKDTIYKRQLHLNDLLDVAISILPRDALALLMIVNHDIYESDDDDFCCGRAYGGSRVAVVSTARYNPTVDANERVDAQHPWPASHCLSNVLNQCELAECEHLGPPKKKTKRNKGPVNPTCDLLEQQPAESPLHQAVAAHTASPSAESSTYELWLSRVCKTASHELGHCLGMAHCVYYACIMQSTASVAEDVRQPPYLCPIDQRKMLVTTGKGLRESYEALEAFCKSRKDGRMWAAFGAWLRARIEHLQAPTGIKAGSGNRLQPIVVD